MLDTTSKSDRRAEHDEIIYDLRTSCDQCHRATKSNNSHLVRKALERAVRFNRRDLRRMAKLVCEGGTPRARKLVTAEDYAKEKEAGEKARALRRIESGRANHRDVYTSRQKEMRSISDKMMRLHH